MKIKNQNEVNDAFIKYETLLITKHCEFSNFCCLFIAWVVLWNVSWIIVLVLKGKWSMGLAYITSRLHISSLLKSFIHQSCSPIGRISMWCFGLLAFFNKIYLACPLFDIRKFHKIQLGIEANLVVNCPHMWAHNCIVLVT